MGSQRRRSQHRSIQHQKHRRSRCGTLDELRTPVFTPLNAEEQKLRELYEIQVKTAFYTAGVALTRLQQLRLYRSTHTSFEEFCLDVFSFSRDYAYLMIAAAKVYQNLADNLPTTGRQLPLPTKQRQLRPIIKARLDDDAQVEIWQMAIALADGKIPSSSIVAEAVNSYLAQNDTRPNPFQQGEVCRIVVGDNSKLKGLGGSWCIVESIGDCYCLVNTWNNQLSVPVNNLEARDFNQEEYQALEEDGVRMTNLHQTGKLDIAAMWVLNGLAKLERPYLTALEEKLLALLEAFYIYHDVE
jgi:hypothetical protein